MVQLLRTWERHRNMTCQYPYATCWPSKNVLAQDLRNGHLALLRRPAIGLGTRAAHQHCPFTVAQAVGLAEGFDGLGVVDDREGAGPVGAPQAKARWSRMKRVSGWRSISAMPASTLPQHSMLTGKSCRIAARRRRSRPGAFGSRCASCVIMMRMPSPLPVHCPGLRGIREYDKESGVSSALRDLLYQISGRVCNSTQGEEGSDVGK